MTSSSNEQADYLCDEALVMCKSGEFQNLLGKVKRDASLGLNVWQRSDRQPETTSIPMARAPAFEKTRNELKVTSALKNPADRSRLVRHATRLIVEQAPESEGGRRTNVIPHGFGARSTEAHVAAVIRASETSKRIVISEFELKQLKSPREHLHRVHAERTALVKLSASHSRISSNGRTFLPLGKCNTMISKR